MQMRFALYSFWVALALFLPRAVHAATYTVGPSGRDYTQLSTLVDSVNLEPADMVLVDGGTNYNGAIIVRSGDRESGRAHVCTPVTNAHPVPRIPLELNKKHSEK